MSRSYGRTEIIKFPNGKFGARRKVYDYDCRTEYLSLKNGWCLNTHAVEGKCQFDTREELNDALSGRAPDLDTVIGYHR